MQKINELLKKYNLKPRCYTKKGNTIIVNTDSGKYVIKERRNNNKDIFSYLNARNFNYYPDIINNEEKFYLTKYVDDIYEPIEQRMLDMIDLVALLHNKTTHYKEVDEDDYKKIFEDISNNIEYLQGYYTDLITIIESKVYMSPSEYLLARNISKIYAALKFTKGDLLEWYQLVKDKRKQRQVVLHNNLELDHFILCEERYLVSWDKSRIGIPIFDLYKLYRKHGLDFDFSEILKRYEKEYPLLLEERKLLFILIALPDKIELYDTEYNLCKKIGYEIDLLYKTENFIAPYYKDEQNNE